MLLRLNWSLDLGKGYTELIHSVLHTLNHFHKREDAPKTKVKGRYSKGNGYHVQHIGNGSATSSSTSIGFGMGHRTPTSNIPTCSPPD